MHKIFAKPLFLGKKVVFLPQCHSTNDEMSHLLRQVAEPEGSVIYTDHQLSGRGQRGNVWMDERGKNILMSILLRPKNLKVSDQFYLNLVAGITVLKTLKKLSSKEISLKWPNDVYINDKKIAGILIENSIKKNTVETAIVGIGLNTNQSGFNLLNATSLLLETDEKHERESIMEVLLSFLEQWYLKLLNGNQKEILDEYHKYLLWKDELHEFQAEGMLFSGVIRGIDQNGQLVIETSGEERKFRVKEVSFIH